jgi:hypothetical protein
MDKRLEEKNFRYENNLNLLIRQSLAEEVIDFVML